MPKPLETFILKRNYTPECTTGDLINSDGKHIVYTLEPPNRKNAKDNPDTKENEAGCIPEGTYLCFKRDPKVYAKARFKDNWEISNVPNKAGVVFHSGNYWFQSQSCILLATHIQNMNPRNDPSFDNNKKWLASGSIDALNKFSKIMPNRFMLKITSIDTLCKV